MFDTSQFLQWLSQRGIHLDAEQAAVVTSLRGSVAVRAAPGSGKTTSLVCRIAFLLTVLKVHPKHFLIVTFSRKAATELRMRLAHLDLLEPEKTSSLTIGTFHSVFLHILLRYAAHPRRLLSEQESFTHFRRVWEKNGKRENRDEEREVHAIIGLLKNGLLRAVDLSGRRHAARRLRHLYTGYEQFLSEQQVMDYDDILLDTHALLVENESLRLSLADQYRYVLVDEFQDTCVAQFAVLRLLCGPETQLWVVGDEDQCIYAFRGANPSVFSTLQSMQQVSESRLTTNYRSGDAVIEAANRLIDCNRNRQSYQMRGTGKTGITILCRPRDAQVEAEHVPQLLMDAWRERGAVGSVAILYRTHEEGRWVRTFVERRLSKALEPEQRFWSMIKLMTLHRSKGLEFDLVGIINVTDESMPHARSLSLGRRYSGDRWLEEERRLFYVGITRARDTLIVSAPLTARGLRTKPSRFLAEMGFTI